MSVIFQQGGFLFRDDILASALTIVSVGEENA
jgi:hypothetical protein